MSKDVTGCHIYHDALRQARLAIRYSDGTEEDQPVQDFIHQRDDAKDDAHRLHKDKMAFLERLLTCRLRCGYIINHCRDHAQAKGEAEEMLRVIEGVVPPSATLPEALLSDAKDAARYRFLQRTSCGNATGGKGSDEECYLSLNPRDMDAAIDSHLEDEVRRPASTLSPLAAKEPGKT